MLERLRGLAVEQYAAGHTTSDINVIASWMHSVRAVFDLMPVDGEAGAARPGGADGRSPWG